MADDRHDESDPGFRIVDKRQGAPGDEGEKQAGGQAEEATPAHAESAGEGEPRPQPGRQESAGAAADAGRQAAGDTAAEEAPPELEAVDAAAVVQYCISILSGHAWQWMGLIANPLTKKVERDLDQARTAIDCADALFKQIEARLPQADARQLRSVLSDLRVNFVRQSSQDG